MIGSLTAAVAAAALLRSATAQPFQPGSGVGPLGSLRTSDYDGPYNISLLTTQALEVEIGAAARGYKGGISDKDIVDFLVNVECLEGQFDTWGVFGQGFIGNLSLGGPVPMGARMANLTDEARTHLAEVALNEQGHALFTRHAGGMNPCTALDFDGGFNQLIGKALELGGMLEAGETIESKYGAPFDPFKNDQNFIMSVLTLEELGATGNKGLIGLLSNPVLANGVAGLATSATAQATIERRLLWDRKDLIIEPIGMTAQEVFAYISAYRDAYDGPSIHDQGIVNTDPRFIYVPFGGVNTVPTDVRGLTFNRTPQQAINILTIGANDGIGGFFPEGLLGKINTPEGYADAADGYADWPACPPLAVEQSVEDTGMIGEPITGVDMDVLGQMQLTQPLNGTRIGSGADGRGLQTVADFNNRWLRNSSDLVNVAQDGGELDMMYNFCGNCVAPAPLLAGGPAMAPAMTPPASPMMESPMMGSPDSSGGVSYIYQQCAGTFWSGPTTCAEGLTCEQKEQDNGYYGQCVPDLNSQATGEGVFQQCGGEGYEGPGTCAYGNTCKSFNQYFSQCVPPTYA